MYEIYAAKGNKAGVAPGAQVLVSVADAVMGRIKLSKTTLEWRCNLSWYATFDLGESDSVCMRGRRTFTRDVP
jgi:hypothetical protein